MHKQIQELKTFPCKYLNLSKFCDHKCMDSKSTKTLCNKRLCPLTVVKLEFEKIDKNRKVYKGGHINKLRDKQ